MVDAFAFSPYRFDWLSNTYLSNANDDQPDGPSSNEPEPGMNEAHVLDRLTVGIPEIDADHQRLMEHYQALIQTLEPGQDISAFAQSFDGFLQEVDEHFEREEAIMLVLRYDDYDQHRAEHKKLARDAVDFVHSVANRYDRFDCLAVARYFHHWLTQHIETHDKDIGRFVASQRQS